MTAPDWLIETMNVEPVVRQSASKHSAWKYMIAANGPIRTDVPQRANNIGDYDYHECTRGIDSLTAFQNGGSQYRECLDAHQDQYPSQLEHDGVTAVFVIEDFTKRRLGLDFQAGCVSLIK